MVDHMVWRANWTSLYRPLIAHLQASISISHQSYTCYAVRMYVIYYSGSHESQFYHMRVNSMSLHENNKHYLIIATSSTIWKSPLHPEYWRLYFVKFKLFCVNIKHKLALSVFKCCFKGFHMFSTVFRLLCYCYYISKFDRRILSLTFTYILVRNVFWYTI